MSIAIGDGEEGEDLVRGRNDGHSIILGNRTTRSGF